MNEFYPLIQIQLLEEFNFDKQLITDYIKPNPQNEKNKQYKKTLESIVYLFKNDNAMMQQFIQN